MLNLLCQCGEKMYGHLDANRVKICLFVFPFFPFSPHRHNGSPHRHNGSPHHAWYRPRRRVWSPDWLNLGQHVSKREGDWLLSPSFAKSWWRTWIQLAVMTKWSWPRIYSIYPLRGAGGRRVGSLVGNFTYSLWSGTFQFVVFICSTGESVKIRSDMKPVRKNVAALNY